MAMPNNKLDCQMYGYLGCGFNCETFRLKSMCTFSPKFAQNPNPHPQEMRRDCLDVKNFLGTRRCVPLMVKDSVGFSCRPALDAPDSPFRQKQLKSHTSRAIFVKYINLTLSTILHVRHSRFYTVQKIFDCKKSPIRLVSFIYHGLCVTYVFRTLFKLENLG